MDKVAPPSPLTSEHYTFLKEHLRIVNFDKHQVISDGRSNAGCYYHIKQGVVRAYSIIGDEERSIDFYLAGDAFQVSHELSQALPIVIYQCLENTTAAQTLPSVERLFYQTFPEIKDYCLQQTELQLAKQQAEFLLFKSASPEARYQQLIHNRPKIIEQVPKYLIADYLGIKPESLSRLVKRLKTANAPTEKL